MPIYLFRCENGHEFEKLIGNNVSEEDVRCCYCNGKAKKIFSSFVHAKGAGVWVYEKKGKKFYKR